MNDDLCVVSNVVVRNLAREDLGIFCKWEREVGIVRPPHIPPILAIPKPIRHFLFPFPALPGSMLLDYTNEEFPERTTAWQVVETQDPTELMRGRSRISPH